jgi:hypothetical protein
MASNAKVCGVCQSTNLQKLPAAIMDFVAARMFDYPIGEIYLSGNKFRSFLFSRTIKCRKCGFVFCELRPSKDEIDRYYDGYGSDEWIKSRGTYEPQYLDYNQKTGESSSIHFKDKFLAIENFLSDTNIPSTGRLLDFGGGTGEAISPNFDNFEKYSYDISGLSTISECTALKSLQNVQSFEIVLCQEVLEHVSEVNEILLEISKVKEKGTYLFVTVPLEIDDSLEDLKEGLVFHEHINKFTRESLSVLLIRNGFSIEKIAVCEFEIFGQKNKSIFCLSKVLW